MAIWAIVNKWTRHPISKQAFTTAATRRDAWKNFNKKGGRVKGCPSKNQLAEKIEIGYWDIIEMPPKERIIPEPTPEIPPTLSQDEFTFEAYIKKYGTKTEFFD